MKQSQHGGCYLLMVSTQHKMAILRSEPQQSGIIDLVESVGRETHSQLQLQSLQFFLSQHI